MVWIVSLPKDGYYYVPCIARTRIISVVILLEPFESQTPGKYFQCYYDLECPRTTIPEEELFTWRDDAAAALRKLLEPSPANSQK